MAPRTQKPSLKQLLQRKNKLAEYLPSVAMRGHDWVGVLMLSPPLNQSFSADGSSIKTVLSTLLPAAEMFSQEDVLNIVAGAWETIRFGKIDECRVRNGVQYDLGLIVRSVFPVLSRESDIHRYSVQWGVLIGPLVRETFHFVYSKGTIQRLIRQLGGKKYDKYRSEDFFGLTAYASVALRFNTWEITIYEGQPASFLERNRKLLSGRHGPCLLNMFPTCRPCGLGAEQCPLAFYRNALPVRECACKIPSPHEGPILLRGFCIDCIRTNRWRYAHDENEHERHPASSEGNSGQIS